MALRLCGPSDNDLSRALSATTARYETPEEAIAASAPGDGLLLLADGYPDRPTTLPADFAARMREKGVRVYLEFAGEGPRETMDWRRAVVASDFFAPALTTYRILAVHNAVLAPLDAGDGSVHLAAARVAGFDHAVYGLPSDAAPLLAERGNALVAATALSRFVTARFAPEADWIALWQRILQWLQPDALPFALHAPPSVHPAFGPDEPLPADAEASALRRGLAWYRKSRLLVPASRVEALTQAAAANQEIGPAPPAGMPDGDGCFGLLEGYDARIGHDGRQGQRLVLRCDCLAESALALSFGDDSQRAVAANLLDFLCFETVAFEGPRGDPSHPAYGLAAWGVTNAGWEKAFYGDDNARMLFAMLAAAANLSTDRWDDRALRCLFANLRFANRNGFRRNRMDLDPLAARGWKAFADEETINPHPHYQAFLWAAFLLAHRKTGFTPFFEKAERAIRLTMDAYPDGWKWTNGFAQEKARMLLPLAWLVRADDTPERRAWLRRIADDLLALQAGCGALREELGADGRGEYGPPASNAAYGTNEATLIQHNGDPVCDLLYTTNFAFLALHEAAVATGEGALHRASDRLAAFLCRIQPVSTAHPELEGAWFRAFDFARWEVWASNADAGWGAWSVETGWTQGWITTVLALRGRGTSLWDLAGAPADPGRAARWRSVFFDERGAR